MTILSFLSICPFLMPLVLDNLDNMDSLDTTIFSSGFRYTAVPLYRFDRLITVSCSLVLP